MMRRAPVLRRVANLSRSLADTQEYDGRRWSDSGGRRAINIVGEESMREFLRSARKVFSGLYLPES